MENESCYGGGDIAGAIFGTLVAVVLMAVLLWWLYKKNYIFKRKDPQLMPEDPEATAKGDYAFDNPAFKTDGAPGATSGNGVGGGGGGGGGGGVPASKTGSPLDPSWTAKQSTIEKQRKTVDDSYVNVTAPRLVSLRGSDFTGLGVEVYGGLKEGIFVKKVMPQGPAAGLVNTGDRITSITIDFRHIVQEDAMTILSYASPYNVQLELVGGTRPVLPQTQSPKPGHQSLTHPLYRSSSQSDLNTIERNSRKKLFPSEDSPLKMDNNRAGSPTQAAPGSKGPLPTVHKEHEREPKKHSFKQQMREMIEEKFQTKHADVERKASSPTMADDVGASAPVKKGHKFGIRVFPPSVNDKLFGKSPTKVQADNENNTNLERKESDEQQQQHQESTRRSPSPPEVKKRTKEPKMATVPDVVGVAATPATYQLEAIGEFQRQNSLTSSGIRRDASGIPQEVPSFMMQAANAARDNRKSGNAGPFTMASSSAEADAKRKGKAPRPPHNEAHDLDESTVTMDTNLSSTDEADGGSAHSRMLPNGSFSSTIDSAGGSAIGRMNFSDNFAEEVLNCTLDSISHIEQFNGGAPANRGPSNSSTPKSDRKKTSSLTESELMMRTNSLEELHNGQHHDNESDVEQEQRKIVARGNKIELNASDIIVHQSSPSPTPLAASDETSEEEPQDDSNRRTASLGDLSKLEPQKSATGSASNTLERAQSLEITGDSATTTVTIGNGADNPMSEEANALVDAKEMVTTDGLSSLQRNRLKGASAWGNLEDAINYGELLVSNGNDADRGDVVVVKENGYTAGVRQPLVGGTQAIIVAEAKKIDVSSGGTTTLIVQRAAEDQARPSEEHVSLTTIGSGYGRDLESPESDREEQQPASVTNHLVKITGAQYDTNIPDDVKVSRYPFGSLERPKSDVLKKLLGQKEELENTPSVFISADGSAGEHTVSKIRIEGGHRPVDAGEPISLTLINAPESAMSDQTESSQPSPVFTSNTNGVSSINISSLEYDDQQQRSSTAINGFTAMNGMIPKFSLSDNIVTISGSGGSGSQPSSIIMIDDEKLDFSLQTLDDFDDPLVDDGGVPPFGAPMPPPDFSNAHTPNASTATAAAAAVAVEPVMLVVEASERRPAGEPPLPPQRSSITMNRRGSGGAPLTNGSAGGGFVTEITLKPVAGLAAEPAASQPTAAERCTPPHQNGLIVGRQESDSPAQQHAAPPGKPPIVTKKPPKPDNKPTTPPSRIPVERRMSNEHSFIPRNAEIKFTTATYESPSSVPRTPPTRPLGVDQIRSNFERSNSKTEIPVLIRRTSIPSISLSHGGGSHGQAGGSMSNLSSIAGQQQPGNTSTKASPSRIPVFNSAAGTKFGYQDANGGRSPPPASASPTTNGGASPQHQQNYHASPPVTTNGHHNHHHHNNNHHLVSNNKVSVSITSIKNQAKHPSGKF
ncbi:uncharacterized protein LOC131206107 [Anopheles bellator]|uniref:uncharacterized protein LOC131206107 n=1 Tax=Anopheles bellator TaxID=139047 RepID=UPI002648E269|nr:uncharacterized protein LOC131206107 [Anopheles bellator]